MHNPKEMWREIYISPGSEEGKQSPTPSPERSIFNKKKTKPFHPPTEALRDSPPLVRIEGPHNPKDEKLVDTFREMLSHDGRLPSNKHFDNHTLLRFLRKKDFDLKEAKDAFTKYIKWREDFSVDSISKEFKFEEYRQVKKYYPHGFHGVDRYGRPVYIERIGMVDLDMLLQVTTIERFVKHHVYEQEKTMNLRYPSCSRASMKHIASTFTILDVKDVGMPQFSKPARSVFMEIQKIGSAYYPDTLHQLFIINAGSRFKVLWKAIRVFLDARTLAKIRVLGCDYKRALMESIDPSNVPSFLGGDCTCSESGGCLFSDKGPWNDPKIIEMLRGGGDVGCDDLLRDVTARVEENVRGKMKSLDEPLLQKIREFELVLEDGKKKIGMLEIALGGTKLVLQGLAQHMEELKKML